jgi:hypothetical protein
VAPRRVRFHDLRHTYATLRVAKGDNIVDISSQLGHHDPGFTLKALCARSLEKLFDKIKNFCGALAFHMFDKKAPPMDFDWLVEMTRKECPQWDVKHEEVESYIETGYVPELHR